MLVCPECGATSQADGRCPADGSAFAHVGEDLLLGTTIGAYRIARLLGIGGMGRVYKGVHPQIGSRVAIKVLSRECSDRRDLVERFFAEAKAVNLIRHESIVNVLDLSTLPDGRPYIVMEYLDGAPLAALIERAAHQGPLPLGGIARLAAEVLDALGAAHAKGIVHRDLKPDNIFVSPQGRAKVLDFGIAKLQPELGGSSTHTGSLLGTPHYMSPEQASGRPVDARADIYAIGVILFECATLQKPFLADSLFDLLRKHVEAPPPSPRALRRDMPEGLEHIIYTALAKQPDHRFATAQAMSMALQHATQSLPPEQWAPLSGSHHPSSGGWSPTPPASWAGSQRPQFQMPSTVSAGQVTAQQKPSSKKGIYIGLGALLLVGGGIAAAVLASGGSSQTANAGSGSGSVVAEVPAEPPAKEPTPPPVEPPVADPLAGFDDGVNLDPAIDEMLKDIDPEALKAMPELDKAVKKYGSFAKIPKSERAKLIAGVGRAANNAALQAANALAGGAPPSPTTQSWIPDGALPMAKWDPKHLDVDALITHAYNEAKKAVPDANLTWVSIDNVFPDGHADLTLPAFGGMPGSFDMRLVSASHSKRDPSIPRGVHQELKCEFRVDGDPSEPPHFREGGHDCKKAAVPKPRCKVAQVWKKILAQRADLKDAVAQLVYQSNIVTHKVVWMVTINDEDAPFSEQFPDDC